MNGAFPSRLDVSLGVFKPLPHPHIRISHIVCIFAIDNLMLRNIDIFNLTILYLIGEASYASLPTLGLSAYKRASKLRQSCRLHLTYAKSRAIIYHLSSGIVLNSIPSSFNTYWRL